MSNRDVNPASDRLVISYEPTPVFRAEHAESRITRLIEQQTARIPSDIFLFAALSSMATSLVLELAGRTGPSRFIGMWPAPLLVMGVYNKLVKVLRPG